MNLKDIKIEKIEKLEIKEDDILVATVETKGLSPHVIPRYMESVRKGLSCSLKCEVLVIPSTIKLTSINGRDIIEWKSINSTYYWG